MSKKMLTSHILFPIFVINVTFCFSVVKLKSMKNIKSQGKVRENEIEKIYNSP